MKTKKTKSKINFFRLITPIIIFSSTTLLLSSCASDNKKNSEIQNKLENEVSRIESSNIALKQEILTPQEFENINEQNILEQIYNIEYSSDFHYSISEFNKENEYINFKIKISSNDVEKETKLIKIKCVIKEENNQNKIYFDKAYKYFNIKVKNNIDISKIDASTINDQKSLLDKFYLINDEEQISYNFINIEKIETTKINVIYKLISKKDNTIFKNKSIIISGFLNPNDVLQNKFNELFLKFNISAKSNVSNIYASEIKNEDILKQYFNINYIDGLTSELVSIVIPSSNNTMIKVEYKLSLTSNKEIMRNKIFNLFGFKKPITDQEVFDKSYDNFNLKIKSEKNIGDVLASTIINEQKIDEYFDVNMDDTLNKKFISVNLLENDKQSIVVIYELSLKKNSNIRREKLIKLSGFKKPQLNKNELLLNEALNKLKIVSVKDISNISAREFIKDWWTYKNYVSINVDEVRNINSNLIDVDDLYRWKYYRVENNTTQISIHVEVRVGKKGAPNFVIGTKELIVDGFKSLITGIDVDPIKFISTPIGAVSYKNKLEPIDLYESNKTNYNDLLKKITWDDYKKEIMYQLRFWMYQIFEDNFSEINYWVLEKNDDKYQTKFSIEGIIENDVNNLEIWVQQIGSAQRKFKSIKKGQKIQINFWPNGKRDSNSSWRPTGLIMFEHGFGSGDIGFSFQKGLKSYTSDPNKFPLKLNKKANLSQLGTNLQFSLEIKIDNEIIFNEYKWNQANSFMFTFGVLIDLSNI